MKILNIIELTNWALDNGFELTFGARDTQEWTHKNFTSHYYCRISFKHADKHLEIYEVNPERLFERLTYSLRNIFMELTYKEPK